MITENNASIADDKEPKESLKDASEAKAKNMSKVKIRRTHLMDLYPAGTFNKMVGRKTAKNTNKTTLTNAGKRK